MAKYRYYNYDLEADRLAENVYRHDPSIQDRDSFDAAYTDYLSGKDAISNTKLKNKTFAHLRSKVKTGVKNERLHKRAGGKSLAKDRGHDARVITKNRREYVRLGADKADLAGYDTTVQTPHRFNIMATVGRKTVYARQVEVSIRGKRVVRYRDTKGRFAKRTR